MADFHSLVIDHLNIGVSDLDRALPVYEAALRPLGLAVFFRPEAAAAESRTRMIGFGRTPDRPVFWLVDAQPPGPATHIAFAAADRAQVDASTPPRWPPAPPTTARRGCAGTTRTTTARSSATRTARTSRPCATPPPERRLTVEAWRGGGGPADAHAEVGRRGRAGERRPTRLQWSTHRRWRMLRPRASGARPKPRR